MVQMGPDGHLFLEEKSHNCICLPPFLGQLWDAGKNPHPKESSIQRETDRQGCYPPRRTSRLGKRQRVNSVKWEGNAWKYKTTGCNGLGSAGTTVCWKWFFKSQIRGIWHDYYRVCGEHTSQRKSERAEICFKGIPCNSFKSELAGSTAQGFSRLQG